MLSDHQWHTLGDELRRVQDEGDAKRGQVPSDRQFSLPSPTQRERRVRPPRRWGWPIALAGCTAAACLITYWLTARPSVAPAPQVSAVSAASAPPSSEEGRWLRGRSLVRLSDRSEITLEDRDAQLRLLADNEDSVRLVHEVGAVLYRVQPKRTGQWLVHIGPYEVRVMGTEFRIRWEPYTQRFELAVLEGVVELSNRTMNIHRTLRAGENYIAGQKKQPSSVRESTARAIVRSGATHATQKQPVDDRDEFPARPTPPVPTTAHAAPTTAKPQDARDAPPSDWRRLAADGAYRSAMRELSPQLPQLQASVDVNDLLLIADICRYARNAKCAYETYRRLRTRFPRTQQAALAAFQLGRLVFTADPHEGAEWFERYMRDQPHGKYAKEALGRRLEVEASDSGPPPRALAIEYLKRFPAGAHAPLAKRILKR